MCGVMQSMILIKYQIQVGHTHTLMKSLHESVYISANQSTKKILTMREINTRAYIQKYVLIHTLRTNLCPSAKHVK